MGLLNEIKVLTESYRDLSVELMNDLCKFAGVQYREPKEAKALLNDLHSKGYHMRVTKFTNPESGVGQYIILTDMNLNVIKGYKVWIDFDGYCVRKENVTTNEQVLFLTDNTAVVN